MKLKRIASLVLTLCMCLTILPILVQPAKAANVTLSAADVVNYVKGLVGSEYPSGYCLAFVADCFEDLGATRSSACCAYKYGDEHIQSTDSGNIPIGADVFFGNCGGTPDSSHKCSSPSFGHIGIYIGDGYFIHATDGKVQKGSLSNSFWSQRFRGWGYHGNVTIANPSSFDFWAGEDGETISGKHTFWWKQEGYGSCDVNLDLNGKALGTIYPDENGLFSYTLDTTEYENGTYTLGAIIRSSNGLEKYVTRTIHIDNGSFGFWSGEDGETISGTYKFWWKQTGYESCDIELNLSGKNLGTLYPDENGLFSYTIDTSKYENGSYTISATIRSTNKPEKTVSRTIYIDNGEMFFDFWSGEDGETISGTYKFWWKQVGYGECDVTIDLNGDVLTTKSQDENGLFAYTLDTTKYENGTYTIGANIQGANGSEKYVTRTIHINNVTAAYSVSYNANGGTDAPGTQTKHHNEDLVLSSTIPIRAGYIFLGWSESETANSATYLPGDTITENRELVLYAVWEEIAVTEVEILESPSKTVYQIGDHLDITGLTLKATYNDGTTETITTGFEVSGFDSTTAGTKTVIVSYGGKSTSFTVTVEKKEETDPNAPQIIVSNATAIVGKQVQVKLSLANNPGITSMMLEIGYNPDILELMSVTDAGKLGNAGHSDNYGRNPYVLSWENDLAKEDYVVDGEIVTLTFQVAEDAPVGETAVTVSYTYDNYEIFNAAGEEVWFATVNGSVNVIDVLLGDVNSDGVVNAHDRVYLARYLAKWTDYPASVINMDAADVNGDGVVNAHDRVYLARHLAKWSGYETLGA